MFYKHHHTSSDTGCITNTILTVLQKIKEQFKTTICNKSIKFDIFRSKTFNCNPQNRTPKSQHPTLNTEPRNLRVGF